MKRNERLSVALHALLHLALRPGASMTSAEMAQCIGTDSAVVRRTLSGLREASILTSVKGHGGGWRLARPLDQLSLADVQAALGTRIFNAPARAESPGCLIERAVHQSLDDAVEQANRFLDQRLAQISLADIAGDVATWHAAGSPQA